MGSNLKIQELFLFLLTTIYLISFLSLFIQIPGLYGDYGIHPAKLSLLKVSDNHSFWEVIFKHPNLLHILTKLGIENVELGLNIICFCGIFLSFSAFLFEQFRHSGIFFILWLIYFSICQIGGLFIQHIWDYVLLEIGFISIFIAPLCMPFLKTESKFSEGSKIAFWLIKWILFRIIFTHEIIKLLTNCPEWWNLTGLFYYPEFTYLPNPLTWTMSFFSKNFLLHTFATDLMAQMFFAILVFSPIRMHKIFLFCWQIYLCVSILTTSNFNYLFWMIFIMSLTLLDDQVYDYFFSKKTVKEGKRTNEKIERYFSIAGILKVISTIAFLSALIFVMKFFFSVYIPFVGVPKLNFTIEELKKGLKAYVPITILIAGLSLTWEVISALFRSFTVGKKLLTKLFNVFGTLFIASLTIFIFSTSLVPYTNIEPDIQSRLPSRFHSWYKSTEHLHLSHHLWIFNALTGVEGRKEVIFEGSNEKNGVWKEYNFLYKPGDMYKSPSFVAPYQPLLDWQMWYAANTTFQENPWLKNFAYRLLTNQQEVIALLGKGPFDESPPKYLRASVYLYQSIKEKSSNKGQWWKREYLKEYLSITSLEDKQFIDSIKGNKIYKNPELANYPKKKSTLVHFFDYLHTYATPKDGFIICMVPLVSGFLYVLFLKNFGLQFTKTKKPKADVVASLKNKKNL